MNWDNVGAFMDTVGKDALRDCSWIAATHDHQINHMGDGLSQFALHIVTQQEQCASVGKAQHPQIDLLQRVPSEPGAPKLTDWAKADLDNIFTTNSSTPGWCNDPAEAYLTRCNSKKNANANMIVPWGRSVKCLCYVLVLINSLGMGIAVVVFFRTDCSIPSVTSSVRDWPQWLRPAQVDVPDSSHLSGKVANLNAVVKKKRPLIYVYDLPPDFNSLLLEGRHFRLECVNRIYGDKNSTLWTDQLYGASLLLELKLVVNL